MNRRKSIYSDIHDKFGFLWKLPELSELNNDIIRQKANHLLENYAVDLDQTFPDECVHLAQFLKDYGPVNPEQEGEEKKKKRSEAKPLLNFLKTLNLESMFPNVEIALHNFLTMPVTNCSGERSFSALKRVQNYLLSNLRCV